MFRRLPDLAGEKITFVVDGVSVVARSGDTVAAALLAAGFDEFRSMPASRTQRGPYCMMGVCFDCLVTIDGVGNRQSCLVPVTQGMRVERQNGARDITREASVATLSSKVGVVA